MRRSVLRGLAAVEIAFLGAAVPSAAVELAFETAPPVADHRRAIGRSRELLRGVLELYPGTTVAVGYEGRIVWSAGFGYADVRRGIPVSFGTRFRIGRVSEALTAAAALRLAEGKRLDLDAPVSRYVAGYPEKGFGLTSRQLAGHLAGLPPEPAAGRTKRRRCTNFQDALAPFANVPLASAPGTAFLHSSHGYVLLSAVLAAASGQDYAAFMEEEVLRPAGMSATALENSGERHPSQSRFYERGFLGMLRQAAPVDMSCAFGASGFLSTAQDLVRFGMALLGGDLVSTETIPLLFSPQRTRSGTTTGHGLGWHVSVDSRGWQRVSQSGRTEGGRSAIVLVPERRLVVALLANIDGEHLDDHANRIASFFLNSD